MRSRSVARALLAFALVAAVGACSDSEPAGDGHEHAHPEESPTGHDQEAPGHDHGDGDKNFLFTNGEPGDEAQADRKITIRALRGFRFAPESVEVAKDETVTFVIQNRDKAPHEFVLGNAQYQKLHEVQMQEGGVFHEHDDYATTLDAGETDSITWNFTKAGRIQFACHVPGHFDQGMVGNITVDA